MHRILSNIRMLYAKSKKHNHDVFEFELFHTITSCVLGIMKKHAHAHAGPSLLTKFFVSISKALIRIWARWICFEKEDQNFGEIKQFLKSVPHPRLDIYLDFILARRDWGLNEKVMVTQSLNCLKPKIFGPVFYGPACTKVVWDSTLCAHLLLLKSALVLKSAEKFKSSPQHFKI